MENSKKEFIIRKVPLDSFIIMLQDIYATGADYIDIHGVRNTEALQDEITVAVPISYMNGADEKETPPPSPGLLLETSEKLTSEDIADLLNYG